MENMLLSFNKNFFALVEANDGFNFSFKLENFLINTYDLEFDLQQSNQLERNVEGELINLKPKEKFIFTLKGKGDLNNINIGKEFLFVTSKLKTRYCDNTRPIIFDYIFSDNDIPLEDKASNLNEGYDANMFCIPIFKVMILSKNIFYNKKKECLCNLVLEEI